MSSRTPNQEKALAWYCEKNNLRPQLSAHPVYYFLDKSDNESTRDIQHIVAEWKAQRKNEKRRTA